MGKTTAWSMIGIGFCATAVSIGGAGIASAGEVTGNGQEITIHSKSACAFSGLEDWANSNPQPPGGIDVSPGTVQNWGHVKHGAGLTGGANSVQTPFGEEGCNAHLYPNK
ncbi:MAG: hypothetical protein ABI586_10760 [Candidatus Nanopelagicales bacterium]